MANEQMYAVAWRRRHELNERAFFQYLLTSFNAEGRRYLQAIEGRDPATWGVTNHFSQSWLLGMVKDAYLRYGKKQYSLLNQMVTKQEEEEEQMFDMSWAILVASLFMNIDNFMVVAGINNTVKKEIQKFVMNGLKQGLTRERLLVELEIFLRKQNVVRASAIARTEITRIMNQASMLWAQLQPTPLKKKWVVILDGKERPSHNAMASAPAILLNEKFLVGGSLMDAPGDVTAPAQEVVNCRCSLMFVRE